jgi:hypothetical protein
MIRRTRCGEARLNDARLWRPWLRINRVLRVMPHTRWSAEAWAQVRLEFRRALALRSEIRRAGWFITETPCARERHWDAARAGGMLGGGRFQKL